MTGTYQGPRFAPEEWVAASDEAKDESWDGAEDGSVVSDASDDTVDSEDSDGVTDSKHAEAMVQVFLDQWSEKRAILQRALGIHDEPKPNTKGTALDTELHGVAGADASAENEADDGCPRDKTRSNKVLKATILKVQKLTLERLKDEIATRMKKLRDDAVMSDTDVFRDAVEDLSELSGQCGMDDTPVDREST